MNTFSELVDQLRQKNGQVLETDLAIRIKNLHWIGPLAYFHVVYRPVSSLLVAEVGQRLKFPNSLRAFYQACNGMDLYAGTIRLFGCVEKGTPLDRSDPLSLPPLSITDMNQQFVSPRYSREVLSIGTYSYDRSLLCIDRQSERVTCYRGEDLRYERKSWPTIEDWLVSEQTRLSFLFSPDGRLLGTERLGLPDQNTSYES
jgi:hypothetical protein